MATRDYLTIDIGGTYIKYAIVDEAFGMKKQDKVPTPKSKGMLTEMLYGLIGQHPEIAGVAICCPGKVTSDGTVYYGGALPFMHETPLASLISKNFAIPCTVINDGKAAALAEHTKGNLRGAADGAAVILGSGVGGGIILNNSLLMGANNQAGEFSFINANIDAGPITSQMVGRKLSAVHFVNQCGQLLALENPDDGQTVFREIENGYDERVVSLFKGYCRNVASLIMNVQAILDIEKVVIGGGISAQPLLVKTIQKQYDQLFEEMGFFGKMLHKVKIEVCAYSNNANLIGALSYFKTVYV